MPLADRLIHSLAIVTPTDAVDLDDDGDAAPGDPIVEAVRGLIQPKSAREIADSRDAGAELSDHTIYLLLRADPTDGAWISDSPDDIDAGRRYDIAGVRALRYGGTPHLEIDARLVRSSELALTEVS